MNRPRRFVMGATRVPISKIECVIMPAKSKKQQMAAGAALAAKRGKRPKSSLKGASKQMVKSMSEKQLKDFAKTKRKRLPAKKKSGKKKRTGGKWASGTSRGVESLRALPMRSSRTCQGISCYFRACSA
jgi:hypothetical protein